MLDLIEYAFDNNVAIVIDPFSEVGIKITAGTRVITAENSTTVYGGFNAEVIPEEAREALDMLMAKIGSRKASHYGNTEQARKREEMERFWKEGKAIFVSEDQM